MADLSRRVIGALMLRAATFEEVEHDPRATAQAALIVGLAALSSGIGVIRLFGFGGVVRQTVVALIAWCVSAAVLWLVGTRILPGRRTEADVGQLMRTMGFAHAPVLCSFLAIMPVVGWMVRLLILPWALLAIVVAVRQALDYDDMLRALIVCLVAWAAWMAVSMLGALVGFGAEVF